MRILHTADWHLGDRLGRIDRTDDLRRAVERVADYCRTEKADVLLIAGDIFSELARPDSLRDAIHHLKDTCGTFLHDGGTILALTGNHDNESFCQTLCDAMSLASPAANAGITGRMHLAVGPTLLKLPDRNGGFELQFLLMPFPTPHRYFDTPTRYGSLDEKNRQLLAAFSRKLAELRASAAFDPKLPTVLSAHLSVSGFEIAPLFRMSDREDLVFANEEIARDYAYVALGHIHKPQFLAGRENVRYSGSIERLDLGETNDAKSVVLADVGPVGAATKVTVLPLDATPIYHLDIVSPKDQLPTLAERFANSQRDLVNLRVTYTAGVDNLDEVLRELDKVFPRWYAREWKESGALGPALTIGDADRGKSVAETVRDYLTIELTNHSDDERAAVLDRAERLLQEME